MIFDTERYDQLRRIGHGRGASTVLAIDPRWWFGAAAAIGVVIGLLR